MHNTLERRKQPFSQALGLATKMKVTKIMLVFLFNSFFFSNSGSNRENYDKTCQSFYTSFDN